MSNQIKAIDNKSVSNKYLYIISKTEMKLRNHALKIRVKQKKNIRFVLPTFERKRLTAERLHNLKAPHTNDGNTDRKRARIGAARRGGKGVFTLKLRVQSFIAFAPSPEIQKPRRMNRWHNNRYNATTTIHRMTE